MRIAIPTANGLLCAHFGHCEVFTLIDCDPESKTITKTESITPPPHEPGLLPRFLAEKGATVIIAGGMGVRAQQLFVENDIKVLVGAPTASPEQLVTAYLDGSLVTGANLCDH